MSDILINSIYIVAAALFIFGLKLMSSPATAVRGNRLSAVGMFVAVVFTLGSHQIVEWQWIAVGVVVGSVIGAVAAPAGCHDRHAGDGGAVQRLRWSASLLVGWAALHVGRRRHASTVVTILLSILIGGVTFSGSVVAWGKLSEAMTSAAVVFSAQQHRQWSHPRSAHRLLRGVRPRSVADVPLSVHGDRPVTAPGRHGGACPLAAPTCLW